MSISDLQNLGAVGGLILVCLALVEIIKHKTNGKLEETIRTNGAKIDLLITRVSDLCSRMDRLADRPDRPVTGPFETMKSEPTARIKITVSSESEQDNE